MSQKKSCAEQRAGDINGGAIETCSMANDNSPHDSLDWHRIALVLVIVTLAYNIAEAGIAIWAGIAAQSIALVGFGLDSTIEIAAAGALLYRISLEGHVDDSRIECTEHCVHVFVGITFFMLASYVTAQSIFVLVRKALPEESIAGIALAAVSLVVMPFVSFGKIRASHKIHSEALKAEAKETLACSYLSLTLLIGLVANAAFGWWWADPAAALLMVPWLIKEGLEGVGCIQDDDEQDDDEQDAEQQDDD
jgi:divalent metal cation (Fe/Co/Zn/Cd) transporter